MPGAGHGQAGASQGGNSVGHPFVDVLQVGQGLGKLAW